MLGEPPYRFGNRVVGCNGDDIVDHHVQRLHAYLCRSLGSRRAKAGWVTRV
jgi:hypothetical protein